jgi:hypothetical protein
MRRVYASAVHLVVAWLCFGAAQAWAAYAITQSVIAGGGGTSAGGAYGVTGTIGQSVLGTSSGGTFSVAGGFWGGGAVSGAGNFDVTLFVTLAGSATGTVASAPAGISCPPTCTNTFNSVASVSLTGTPTNAGAAFTGWLGDCTGHGTCLINSGGTKNVSATFAPNDGYAFKLDADENNQYDALTDGLLIIRYLFGLTGTSLTNNAIGAGAAVTTPSAMLQRLDNVRPLLDVDGNGQADALTDGLMLIRYLFGLRGNSLVAGVIGTGATRTTSAEIETHIQSLLP